MDTLNRALTTDLSSSVDVPSVLWDGILKANPTPPAFLPRDKKDGGAKQPHHHLGAAM